jgi:outer membrane receptor for monomeric catechols
MDGKGVAVWAGEGGTEVQRDVIYLRSSSTSDRICSFLHKL